ncbi:MAG: hypothetical protein ACJATA_000815 [Sphingobacteriales bacterium]|jgi:hypothetical protein
MKKLLLSLLVAILFAPFAHAQEWEYIPNTDEYKLRGAFEFKGDRFLYNDGSIWKFDKTQEKWIDALNSNLRPNQILSFNLPLKDKLFHSNDLLAIYNSYQITYSTDGVNWSDIKFLNSLISPGESAILVGISGDKLIAAKESSDEKGVDILTSSDQGDSFQFKGKVTTGEKSYLRSDYLTYYQNGTSIFHVFSGENGILIKIDPEQNIESFPYPDSLQIYNQFADKIYNLEDKIFVYRDDFQKQTIHEYLGNSRWREFPLDDSNGVYKVESIHRIENEYVISQYVFFGNRYRLVFTDLDGNVNRKVYIPKYLAPFLLIDLKKEGNKYIGAASSFVFETTDFKSFTSKGKNLSTQNGLNVASQGMDLFINKESSLSRTSNNINFKEVSPFNGNGTLDRIFMTGKSSLLGKTSNNLYISEDNGDTWESLAIENGADRYFGKATNKYFFGFNQEGNLYRFNLETRKFEKTNSTLELFNYSEFRFFGEGETVFMFNQYYEHYKSTNGGLTWTKENLEIIPFQNGKRLFFLTFDNDKPILYEWHTWRFNEITAQNTTKILTETTLGLNLVEYKDGIALANGRKAYYLPDGADKWTELNDKNIPKTFDDSKQLVQTRFGLVYNTNYNGIKVYKETLANTLTTEIKDVSIFPNPNNGAGTLSLENNFNGSLKIIGMDGKEYFSKEIDGSDFDFEIDNSIPGNYLLILTDHKGIVQFKGKLLVY